jgi:iron complex transport system ATP-binding protein
MGARLVLDRVGVTVGGQALVSGVAADLQGGALVALLGPNGAGKTTLLRAIAGLMPAEGAITLDGAALARLSPRERAQRIGYLPQGHQAHWPLPARDIVALGRYPHGAGDPSRLSAPDAAAVAEAMARADVSAFALRDVRTLSGGERARVMMARVFAVGAPVLLADEPTAALDPRHQLAIMAALKAEAERGALVLAVTHDLVLAARFADQALLLHEGRLVADGAPANVLTAARLEQVYGVRAEAMTVAGQTLTLPWSPL